MVMNVIMLISSNDDQGGDQLRDRLTELENEHENNIRYVFRSSSGPEPGLTLRGGGGGSRSGLIKPLGLARGRARGFCPTQRRLTVVGGS